jgi:hypothetical protein
MSAPFFRCVRKSTVPGEAQKDRRAENKDTRSMAESSWCSNKNLWVPWKCV